ncbi:MAG: hypothetical protein NTV49_06765 [Kiritimatiellaeota bacterium]|nr:hypothetical protein [Kiritimatiellota bacterium]
MTPFSHEGSSLLVAALFIALLGGVVTFVIHLDSTDTARQAHMALAVMITVIISGIFVISATARWWMHR